MFLIFASFCRIGEATNPGPELRLGCINPTGLLHKGSLVGELPKGSGGTIWAVSETHLTAEGYPKLSKELAKTSYHMQMGAAVPTKSATLSSVGGKQRGVGFLTTLPNRALTPTWSQNQWEENRFHAAGFLSSNRWIQGGVLYGYAKQPTTKQTREKTDEICQIIHHRLSVHSRGLRFVAGDFNQDHGDLSTMQLWEEERWINVQHWAAKHLSKPIVNTCHGKTVKDHIYLSPELAVYLKDVWVDDTWFKDHAVLQVSFHDLGAPPKVPMWRQPAAIEWEKVKLEPSEIPFKSIKTDPNEWYEDIQMELEDRVHHHLLAHHLPGLRPNQRGRASTHEVNWVTEYSAPARKGRDNDIKPEYHGSDQQHAQWLRQARRLANFVNIPKDNPGTTRAEHRANLWKSIIQASGFPQGFSKWCEKSFPTQTLLEKLPWCPPSQEFAKILHDQFLSYLRAFEKDLNTSRIRKAKQRRLDDPNIIFRDLQQQAPAPVQVLVEDKMSCITELDDQDCAIVVDPPQKWDTKNDIYGPNGKLEVIHAEEDKIWIESMSHLQIGDSIRQENYIAELQELFQKFGSAWSKRWDRHRNVDTDFWDPIVDFARTTLPDVEPMEYQPIDYDQWMASLKAKKKHAAVGPDAVARNDLLNMPRDLTEELLRLFKAIEAGSQWPQQMLVGFVVSLEKVWQAKGVNQYRPITVFAVAYRNWGSIRARQILKHLNGVAPSSCTGNLPGKQASTVWMNVLAQIEEAYANNQPLSGAVIDLVKAFNLLPRYPVFAIMEYLKIPVEILRAWKNSVGCMHRRFKIRRAVGPQILSCTGFPEGDAMSVTAMLAINLVFHSWVTHRYEGAMLWSYVDNIEIVSHNADSTQRALAGLVQLSELLDVEIDQTKTYVWSVQAHERQNFRAANLDIKHFARDLGGHIQYSKHATNSTIVKNIQKLNVLWPKLARSTASYHQKVKAVKAKAWPIALHAIATAHLGPEHHESLRTGVMKSLGCAKSGASPTIHLSLIENPQLDPQCFSLIDTILINRTMLQYDQVSFMFSHLAEDHKKRPPPGPCSVLFFRLQSLAWSWQSNTRFLDHQGLEIDIWFAPIQEVRIRIKQAWQSQVQGMSKKRKTMKGLSHIHPELTTATLPRREPDAQALVRTCLNGTFYTSDRLKHQGRGHDGSCQFCKQPDNPEHRNWECEYFATCRKHLTAAQINCIRDLPPCVKHHGWIPEPTALAAFQQMCVNQEDKSLQFVYPPVLPSHLWLFTDGACRAPTSRIARLASWGVVVGDLETMQTWPVASGGVPGICQTILRAELIAVISACQFAIQCGRQCSLCIDNDLVFRRVRRYQRKECWFKPNQKDVDLWEALYLAIRRLGPKLDVVIKVCSHQCNSNASDEVEQWCFQGNAAADAVAGLALTDNPRLVQQWERLQSQIAALQILREAMHTCMVNVGRRAVTNKPHEGEVDKIHTPRLTREDIHELGPLDPEVTPTLRWQFADFSKFVRWWNNLVDPTQPVQLVSWFQLTILMERSLEGHFLYKKSAKRWYFQSGRGQQNLVGRSNSFSRVIQGLYAQQQSTCKIMHIRPASCAIAFWTQCVALKIQPELLQQSDELLMEGQDIYKTVRALRTYD